ncbi:MAG: HAMP domain-containing sensor histidine kinase [Salinisphaera sp.]|jgi:signal transduction histidine kinase|nr:HAMP domain-containing sensor histidine kinase [Salinisphaera sp.]
MRLNRLARSSAFRSGLAYAALFTLSAVILFAIVYWQTAGTMKNQVHHAIDNELQMLLGEYRDDGLSGLQNAIDDRLESGSARTRYLLVRHGRVLAGDLPKQVAVLGWSQARRPDRPGDSIGTGATDDDGVPIIARGVRLAHGGVLVVAQDAGQLADLRNRLAYALGWGLALTLLLGAAGGAFMGSAALRRVESINRVARRVIDGELSQRMPVGKRNDEFDHLAMHLNRMLDQIEQLMNGMRQVSSDIAHDLRTPLGRLRQGLDTARTQAGSAAEHRAAIDHAIFQTDQILDTFAALLRIAQIESGSRRARFADFDLSVLADTLAETYTAVAEESQHILSCRVEPALHIRGDRELMTQAVANLIENALTHTPAGTPIELTLASVGQSAVISVTDSGPGIPSNAVEKVTQRFYRLEASRSTPGSGLGLSLVAAIAELHGTLLILEDNAPGLRASLLLPLAG